MGTDLTNATNASCNWRYVPERLHPAPSERGVALVITLVLLSIITFMTVTFLVVSRSQQGAVTTDTDQAIARLAADSALEHAKAQLLTPILASGNEFNYGLMVSTNYISRVDFTTGSSGPNNVGYNYPNGAPLVSQRLPAESRQSAL